MVTCQTSLDYKAEWKLGRLYALLKKCKNTRIIGIHSSQIGHERPDRIFVFNVNIETCQLGEYVCCWKTNIFGSCVITHCDFQLFVMDADTLNLAMIQGVGALILGE